MACATVTAPAWELHRPRHGTTTAVAYLEGQECVRLTGPLLRLRVALWDRTLTRRIAATYPRR